MAETRSFTIWNHEPYYGSPAWKRVFVSWLGKLHKVEFYLDVDPASPSWPFYYGCVKKFMVNDYEITNIKDYGDPCDVMRFKIPPEALKNNQDNEISFYFNPVPTPGVQSGGAYGKLTLTADKVIAAGTVPRWWWIVAVVGGLAAVGVVAGVIYEESRRQELEELILLRK